MHKRRIRVVSLVVMTVILSVAFIASPAMAREKTIVAVATFADETGKNVAGKATDAVTNTFVKLKYFNMVERNRIDQVMKEIAHQQTGYVDENTAIEVGKMLGSMIKSPENFLLTPDS